MNIREISDLHMLVSIFTEPTNTQCSRIWEPPNALMPRKDQTVYG